MENVIAIIVIIPLILVAFAIGKGIMTSSNEEKSQHTDNKPSTGYNAYMYVVYVILGLLAIWLFTKIWFAPGINTEGVEFQKLK